MEEELNENDLEERLYAMIHHVDGTQADEITEPSHNVSPRVEEAPRSTVKRYWRTSHNSAYQKINTPKDAPTNKNTPANVNKNTPAIVNKNTPLPVNKNHAAAIKTIESKPKEEKNDAPNSPPATLAILQTTVPQNYVKTVEILEIDHVPNVVELESSDEDEVIEVALPPKPTITIESSDEDADELMVQNGQKTKDNTKKNSSKENKSPNKSNRDVSASPVPSVVSSMSDDFIRGDCLALNISSAQPDKQIFDFSLHGSDLLGDGIPSKRKKKKKSKDRLTSTPMAVGATQESKDLDNIFATPKSKAKNKKPKTKSYTVSEKIIPNADVYDSDSNQSAIDITKNHDAYTVSDKSFPSADVYESDSSIAETISYVHKQSTLHGKTNENDSSDSNASLELSGNNTTPCKSVTDKTVVVDLTNDFTTLDNTGIEENIVIGNISGYSDIHEYGDNSLMTTATAPKELGRFCSTKVPQILYEDLDFDNLKGKDKVCRRRRYSLTTLRAEMEKFYNESWGGENFNHQEIQKNMSRDKSLWVIDPKDRMPNPPKRRVTCNYCNRAGHRDDTCRQKPPVCHMCGHTGHYEPGCPRKICVNCGSPNFMYSTMCRNCAPWRQLQCAECGRSGHPASHCPDTWRRYHNTIDENSPLESCGVVPVPQQQCSGCARRGHLAHSCRAFAPLCALPVLSPRVARYCALYPPAPAPAPARPDARKRLSKSPVAHETHQNKKRMSESDADRPDDRPPRQKKISRSEPDPVAVAGTAEDKAPDFIPIGNRDKKGQVIQDNEVSDTSEVKTTARIYVADDVMRQLRSPAGQAWVKRTTEGFGVDVLVDGEAPFLTVVGTFGDQEAFRSELRAWRGDAPAAPRNDEAADGHVYALPKKRNDVLRKLDSAFRALKGDIGDPKKIYKELAYLQNRHETIKNQKVISPKQLNNNRSSINGMLTKLNMVLLGQAGLAGGAERLDALRALKEKLINFRHQKVPSPLRSEINEHYQTIFTPRERDDYQELMRKFYSTRPVAPKISQTSGKKRKKKAKKTLQQKQVLPLLETGDNPTTVEFGPEPAKPVPMRIKHLIKKLTSFHSQLLKWRVHKNQNQERHNFARKINYQIASLSTSEGLTSKKQMQRLKKARKVQNEARGFMSKSRWGVKGNVTHGPGVCAGAGGS